VTIPNGRVEAEGLNYYESDHRIAFEGGVHSVFQESSDDAPTAAPAKNEVTQ
jgi:hypothetical protein